MADTTKTTKKRTETTDTWTDEEKAAMQEHARELKAAKGGKKASGEADLLAKIASMPPDDRKLAERVHSIVMAAAPDLEMRTWYGMPAYNKNGKLVCFFQPASKFKARYSTFGVEDNAKLDDGSMWATSWALTGDFSDEDEARLTKIVKQAVS